MTNIYIQSALIILIYMVLWFALSHWKKDYSLVDIAWGLGFVVLAAWVHLYKTNTGSIIFFAMVAIWGLRLAVYLFIRNQKKGEDWRYKKMKAAWGNKVTINAFFKIFMLQGGLLWLIALPIMQHPFQPSPVWQTLGVVLWALGFMWEAVADWQLFQFKRQAQNRGKIMTSGLWKFSRHPNYFGEIVLWWGLFLFSFPYTQTWLILLSPITITWLLLRVSGVPMLEGKYKDNPSYQAYISNTNPLIPNFFTSKGE